MVLLLYRGFSGENVMAMKGYLYWVYWALPMTLISCFSAPAVAIPQPLVPSPASSEFPTNDPPDGRIGGGGSHFVLPAPPAGPPPRGRIRGGAQRGTCKTTGTDLTALVPFTQDPPSSSDRLSNFYVWGYTTQAQPTLWFYSPYFSHTQAQDSPSVMWFELQNETDGTSSRTLLKLPSQPGIISVPLPANVTLEVGKRYHWFLKVNCSGGNAPPIYVEGVLQRVIPSAQLSQQLNAAQSPLDKAAIYAQNGIWHDALTLLGTLQQQDSQAIAARTEWIKLLQAIGLADVANQPIVPANTSSNLLVR